MKAAEHAKFFENAEDKSSAIRKIAIDFLREVGTLGKQRGCRSDTSLFALLEEQDAKWRKLARLQPDILPEAFQVILNHEMPELFRRWKGNQYAPTATQQITAPDQLQPSSSQQGEDDVRIGGPAWVCHYCLKRNTHEMSRCVKCHKERNYLTR